LIADLDDLLFRNRFIAREDLDRIAGGQVDDEEGKNRDPE